MAKLYKDPTAHPDAPPRVLYRRRLVSVKEIIGSAATGYSVYYTYKDKRNPYYMPRHSRKWAVVHASDEMDALMRFYRKYTY